LAFGQADGQRRGKTTGEVVMGLCNRYIDEELDHRPRVLQTAPPERALCPEVMGLAVSPEVRWQLTN
jgi:hypothetical protein